jgi:hypothetical protein
MWAGRDYRGLLNLDESGAYPLFELGQDCVDFLARVHELNLQGQVVGDLENAGRVYAVAVAKSAHAFCCRCTGDFSSKKIVENIGVGRKVRCLAASHR